MSLPTWSEIEQATGAGVRALVVDSGVDPHPELPSVERYRVRDLGELGLAIRETEDGDDWGHGTAVAGLLTRHAPGVRISSLRVFDTSAEASADLILAALRWGLDREIDLIVLALSASGGERLADFKDLVDLAFRRRVLLVAAESNEASRAPGLVSSGYPAAFPSVLSTVASSLSPLRLRRRLGALVEFEACGVDVDAPWRGGGHRSCSGNSFAVPHLAALAARLRELRPSWNACRIKAALYELADEGPGGGET